MKKNKLIKLLFVFVVLIVFTFSSYGANFVERIVNANSCPEGYKPPLSGLVAMGSVSDLRKGEFDVLKEVRVHPDVYSGVVIHTTWSALEPEQGVYDFSTIDKALSDISQYNKTYSQCPLYAKLRISKAINPPQWVLKLAGGPVDIVLNNGQTIQVGLYWTTEYRKAWQELQQKLASRYDDNILIREVCVNSGAMITDEPFIAIFNKPTIANLHTKGYTDAAFKATLKGALDDYACWKNTPIDYSFNVLREIDSGKPVNNMDFTLSLMREFRKRYEERAVLSNHGLQENLSKGALPIYNLFTELGAPVATQTKGPSDLTDKTIKTGLKYDVTEFEIWVSKKAGGYADYSQNDLERWAKIIQEAAKTPELSVNAPSETRKSKITITGTSEPNTLILINGKEIYTGGDGSFAMLVSLIKGKNIFTIIATDKAGNKTTKTITVTLDITPPTITINFPEDGTETSNDFVNVSGTITDDLSGIDSATLNGNSLTLNLDGTFSTTVSLTEGNNAITIAATDKAGNKTTKTITVTYKSPVQQIVITLQPNNPMMTVNGVSQEIDPGRGTKPVIIAKWGRTVVPIRAIVEALGGTIEWDGTERKVTINFNGTVIELWIDKPQARVNGEMKWIDPNNHDVKPIIVNDRTMLPLRFVAENLGCQVGWDAATRTITITYSP